MDHPSDAKIAKLSPEAKPYETTLGDGLRVTIQPSGARSFNVRFKFDGKNRNLTLGPVAIGLVEARKLTKIALGKIAGGVNPCFEKAERRAIARAAAKAEKAAKATRNAPARDTVAAVAERYLAEYVHAQHMKRGKMVVMRPATKREFERLLRADIIPAIGTSRLEDAHDEIRRLIENAARRAPVVSNRMLSLLKAMCNWARKQKILATSPCAELEPKGAESSRERILTDEEIGLFWQACETISWPFGPLAQLLLLTGARRDEVGSMTWREVDMKTATWTLQASRCKNNREHVIALSPRAMRLLESLPRIAGAKGFVFTTSGDKPVDGFSRAKRRIDEAMLTAARRDNPNAEIEPWVFHDLRRTAASGMASLRVQPHIVEAALNHKSGTIKGVAAVYNRYAYADEKRAALTAWADKVERLANGETNVIPLRSGTANIWEFGGGAAAE
jgi:integrase